MNDEHIYDSVSRELLSDVSYGFEDNVVKIRCVNCQQAIETTLGKLRMKFSRGRDWLTIRNQKHFRIPFLNIDVTVTLWDRQLRYLK